MSQGHSGISVVIPCFNAEKTIARALRSVMEQSLAAAEVVVVDDGSTDASSTVVDREFPAVRLIRQENRGCAGARNSGVRAARGELLAFLDADDLWLPYRLAVQAPILQARPEVGLVCGPTVWADGAGRWSVPSRVPEGHLLRPVADVFANHRIRTSAVLMRRSVIDQVGLLDESLPSSEDTDFFFRVAAAGWAIAYTRAPLTVGFNVPHRATSRLEPVGRNLLACLARWDPGLNPASPLSVAEYERARLAALAAAGEYAAVDGLGAIARDYFRQGAGIRSGPLPWRAVCLLGSVCPSAVRAGLGLVRRVTGRRNLGA